MTCIMCSRLTLRVCNDANETSGNARLFFCVKCNISSRVLNSNKQNKSEQSQKLQATIKTLSNCRNTSRGFGYVFSFRNIEAKSYLGGFGRPSSRAKTLSRCAAGIELRRSLERLAVTLQQSCQVYKKDEEEQTD